MVRRALLKPNISRQLMAKIWKTRCAGKTRSSHFYAYIFLPLVCALLVSGCRSGESEKTARSAQPTPVVSQSAAVTPGNTTALKPPAVARLPQAAVSAGPFKPVRIKAGGANSFTDSAGNVWVPDQGFSGGETIARPEIEIANTKDPEIYRAERYLMDSFSQR